MCFGNSNGKILSISRHSPEGRARKRVDWEGFMRQCALLLPLTYNLQQRVQREAESALKIPMGQRTKINYGMIVPLYLVVVKDFFRLFCIYWIWTQAGCPCERRQIH